MSYHCYIDVSRGHRLEANIHKQISLSHIQPTAHRSPSLATNSSKQGGLGTSSRNHAGGQDTHLPGYPILPPSVAAQITAPHRAADPSHRRRRRLSSQYLHGTRIGEGKGAYPREVHRIDLSIIYQHQNSPMATGLEG